jgi:glycosyltransferase involved in cell wall biosynthesis
VFGAQEGSLSVRSPGREQGVERAPLVKRDAVCIITEARSFGGVEVHTIGLMRGLIDRGYHIELVTNRYRGYDEMIAKRGWQKSVTITHTDLNGIVYGERSETDEWERVLRRIDAKTLIFPKGNNSFGQIGFLRVCRRKFTRIVFIEHLEPFERPVARRKWLGLLPGLGLWWRKRQFHSRWSASFADQIIAVSERVRDRLLTDFKYPPEKLSVVRNGVPWQEFVRRPEQGIAFRRANGIPQTAYVFGMLARLSHAKGIDIALHALRRLIDSRPDQEICLVIAGDGPLYAELTALAQRLALGKRVLFVGFVPDPKLVLSAFDTILFSSNVEGLPLGLLEGMAAGCVPIVTRVSGMPEVVDSGRIGWVVEPRNPEQLAAAMAAACALPPDVISSMRAQAVARIREHFDVARSQQQLLKLCGLEGPAANFELSVPRGQPT